MVGGAFWRICQTTRNHGHVKKEGNFHAKETIVVSVDGFSDGNLIGSCAGAGAI